MTVLVWCSWVCASGGMERVAANLASGLANLGVRVLLVGPYLNAPDLIRQLHKDVERIEYQPDATCAGLLRTAGFLKRVVAEHDVDVISAHGSIFPLLPQNVPVIWTEHAVRYPHKRMMSGLRQLLWRQVRSRIQSGRWKLVSVSGFISDHLHDQLRMEPGTGHVIYNALLGAEELRELPAPKLQPPYHIGFLGRLEHEKRPEDIFEIDGHLLTLNCACHWHIYGDGSLSNAIRARAAADPSRFHVHGYAADTAAAFRDIDLLLLPSQLEGLPTVVLEARAAGRLVVGWRTAGIPEAADPDGVLVDPPFELSRLAEAIAAALKRGTLPQGLSEEFDFPGMISRYTTLFERCAKTQPSRPTVSVAEIRPAALDE